MKINFPQTSTVYLSGSAFDRLGIEDLIPNYSILALRNARWVSFFPELQKKINFIDDIDPSFSRSHKLSTNEAIEKIDWEKIKAKINIDNLMIYKPTIKQGMFEKKTNINILSPLYSLVHKIENKVSFRKLVGTDIPLPDYEIMKTYALPKNYARLEKKFGNFVIQDSKMSLGRGTFFITSEKDFKIAFLELTNVNSKEVVISKTINGKTASVQACITKYGVFSLPPQLQLVNEPLLIDAKSGSSDKFNGGQWSENDFTASQRKEIKKYTQLLGNKIKNLGYKGIFGIDFMISREGKIFILEINARITGLTPIITGIQRSLNQIPFFLLHFLEYLDAEYELNQADLENINKYTWGPNDYGYILNFNRTGKNITVIQTLEPGTYTIGKNGDLKFEKLSYKLSDIADDKGFLLIDFPVKGDVIKPNQRMGRIITRKKIMDGEQLNKNARDLVKLIQNKL